MNYLVFVIFEMVYFAIVIFDVKNFGQYCSSKFEIQEKICDIRFSDGKTSRNLARWIDFNEERLHLLQVENPGVVFALLLWARGLENLRIPSES